MAEREADTVVILSSELISKITEEYFNKTMFKQKVEIVDLKPTENGYMFSVVFMSRRDVEQPSMVDVLGRFVPEKEQAAPLTPVRLSNGQFAKVKERVSG